MPDGQATMRLGALNPPTRGRVCGFAADGFDPMVISRLREMGFEEGAPIQLLHQGPVWGDPIAVRVDRLTVALRRREADGVLVMID